MRYTHGHSPAVLNSHATRTAENSCAYLLPHLREDMSLLDVGCGPGTITADLAGLVRTVIGIDSSPLAIADARERSGAHPGLEFRQADLYSLPFGDDSFDVVHAHQVLQHLSDPVAALREMARVAKPGGLIAVRDADYGAMTWSPSNEGLERWRDTYSQIARDNGGEPDAGRHLFEWALEAELGETTVTSSTWTFSSDEERTWWASQWAQRVAEERYVAQAHALGLDVRGVPEAWMTWARDDGAWFVCPHGELLARVP